ncbi:MAG: carbamoyltransferase C-terminal domain-containing protein [Blastocatellia bacterium]|nr:carbamoyltransferase C-terminal domain-containing protein [Blastocatellia bacterium]
MYILGISGHHRDAAAALLQDGRIVAAIEEEKLARIKHIGIRQCGGLPYQAIGYCLEAAGIGIDEVDFVTYYLKPRRLLDRQLKFGRTSLVENVSAAEDHKAASLNEFHDRTNTLQLIRRLIGERAKARAVDHQLAHAAGAFYLSGFDRAAILVLSGNEDYISVSMGVGEGRKIRLLKRVQFPHSPGWIYSLVTEYLGFQPNGGEHNTQWLSLSGEPEFLPAFRNFLRIDAEGLPEVDLSYLSTAHHAADPFSEKFYQEFGDVIRRRDTRFRNGVKSTSWTELVEDLSGRPKTAPPDTSYRRNMAHSLQQRLEQVVLALAENLRKEHGIDNLCLAGGVAFNSLLVSRMERESSYGRIFVPPAAGNAGCSIGSALFQWHHQLDQGQPEALNHAYLGPDYSDHEVKPVIDNCKLAYRYLPSENRLLEEITALLDSGLIVAWFQGRAEFGPRSLGARSILASPLQAFIKDNLNLFVKHRESSRPFAASVPEERAEEFFENCTPLSRFLLTVSRVRPEKQSQIPAACFSNGMARVHTVSRRTNPLFWQLLNKFEEKTGVPVLLNTSFNLFGEPVVCTPREAIRSFYCSGIDALAINRFLLQK